MQAAEKQLSRCLSIDLEVSPNDRSILAFAGVSTATDRSVVWTGKTRTNEFEGANFFVREGDDVVWSTRFDSAAQALNKLDAIAKGAECVLGHNLITFDLPILGTANPESRLLQLPAVDTLWINPLAFPRNPYHHLVKHYKHAPLTRIDRSDPHLDARLALQLFADQRQALREVPADMLAAWHWLTTRGLESAGFDLFFTALRNAKNPSASQAREAIASCLAGRVCQSQLRRAIADSAEQGWPLAFAMAWISVSGGKSVMPPWVRHQFPEAGSLVRSLRDDACNDERCGWCRTHHNSVHQLKRWFGFESFRSEPSDPDSGRPLQQAIVETVMAGEDALAILPTGTGKSLCYQLPALSRYDNTGALTVVISPLVALMADQVTGLERQGITSGVTVNGLLSIPERAAALDKIRLGDAAIVLISPEQLRSPSVCTALGQREVGAWVLDEAHCLSKWGHDFRPDYRYIGRFIRESSDNGRVPPVLCLTATAKPEVKAEICDYFAKHLGIDMQVFDGGSRRRNLEFVVQQTTAALKLHDIKATVEHHLPRHADGGAIVYCATRSRTSEIAEYLQSQGIDAERFHAGVQPEEKKTIQQRFIDGDLRVIAATNAFGMGIDKPDVRLVIHADIPSSLENYLQEAGRAGRDQQQAHCVLLYTPDDVERQFGLSARSRLTQREIHGVLRSLRALDRRSGRTGEVIATSGEILIEDEADDITRDSATDDTRVRTAVAWLEEADLLARNENRVSVYPSSLHVSTLEEARAKLGGCELNDGQQKALLAIVKALIEADPDDGISTDELMGVAGLGSDQLRAALRDLERHGLAKNDTVVTAFVHAGVGRPSRNRLADASEMEEALISHMVEAQPDLSVGVSAPLNLRVAAQTLQDEGFADARPEHVTRLLGGLEQDGRGDGGGRGSVSVRKHGAESVQVTLRREWSSLRGIAQRRRRAADVLLKHLLSKLPSGKRGNDLLVSTTLSEMYKAVEDALEADATLQAATKDERKLMERALMWLHEQEIVRLNRGLTVFRPAMHIKLEPGTRGFRQADFAELDEHYRGTVRQIHVMAEFAEQGLTKIADALRLSLDYFRLDEAEFIRRWLPRRGGEINRQTTAASWKRIVGDLSGAQRAIVADNRENTNVLVLAGPGSGKTRVLVHRIAYLIRVRRQNPRGILALAYNRHAAADVRRRLRELIGEDANGVMVLTCHSLAMRLVGASFSGTATQSSDSEFADKLNEVMAKAIALLRGDELEPEEAEESRTRLLAGFRWILVDEYQDIGKSEYDLISALAGRTETDPDARLTLFAVGDDDQNIYSFNGTSPEFIRRFEQDYDARTEYLIENYRSSGHIIDAANAVIAPAASRLKAKHTISRDRARRGDPTGGVWGDLDQVSAGRVQVLPSGDGSIAQAQAVMAELNRLSELAPEWDWSGCAVIAREWSLLEPVRSICIRDNIPVQLANENELSLWHLRETQALRQQVEGRGTALVGSGDLTAWLGLQPAGPWTDLLRDAIEEHRIETGGTQMPAASVIEWLAEWCREARRRQRGLLLLTAHRAKGLEFDHVAVLDGGWDRHDPSEDADASRRLYYVATTRAKQTLTLARMGSAHPFHGPLRANASVLLRSSIPLPPPTPELTRSYRSLTLRGVYLSYPGQFPADRRIHRSIAALSPGDPLQLRPGTERWQLLDHRGAIVGELAGIFEIPAGMQCVQASVSAIATWGRHQSDPKYASALKCDQWEVVIPDLVFEPDD